MSNAAEIFAAMNIAVQGENGESIHKKFKGCVIFVISDTKESYLLDLKNKQGKFSAKKLEEELNKPDLTITLSEKTLINLFEGSISPQQAAMKGKLKLKGKMSLGLKLASVLTATRKIMPKSKL